MTPLAFSVAPDVKTQGCSTTPGGLTPWLLVLALLALSRRRAQAFAALAVVALVPFAARAQYSSSSSPAAYQPLTGGTATTAGASITVPFDFEFFNTVLLANQPVQMSQYGYLAVAVSVLHGDTGITPSTKVATDWLRTRTPVARTHTFLIYDMR